MTHECCRSATWLCVAEVAESPNRSERLELEEEASCAARSGATGGESGASVGCAGCAEASGSLPDRMLHEGALDEVMISSTQSRFLRSKA